MKFSPNNNYKNLLLKFSFPLLKKIKETQKKTDERQDKLIKELQQNIKERPNYTLDFNDEKKQLLAQHNLETDIVELVKRGPDYITSLKKQNYTN